MDGGGGGRADDNGAHCHATAVHRAGHGNVRYSQRQHVLRIVCERVPTDVRGLPHVGSHSSADHSSTDSSARGRANIGAVGTDRGAGEFDGTVCSPHRVPFGCAFVLAVRRTDDGPSGVRGSRHGGVRCTERDHLLPSVCVRVSNAVRAVRRPTNHVGACQSAEHARAYPATDGGSNGPTAVRARRLCLPGARSGHTRSDMRQPHVSKSVPLAVRAVRPFSNYAGTYSHPDVSAHAPTHAGANRHGGR
jgi:hypothetical protein